MSSLTWVGHFEGTASFPVVNRGLVGALERAGRHVLRNIHNDGPALTPLCIAFQYPPQPVNMRHVRQVGLSIWEFAGGAQAVPETFKAAFTAFDTIIVPNQFVYEQYAASTRTPVKVVRYLGVDIGHFTPTGPRADWSALFPGQSWVQQARQIILMIGGTDLRHGWDIALKVLAQLPEDVHLVAKWDTHYPVIQFHEAHPRLHILHRDLDDLAPLYRAADVFLLSARGVGFSLPTIEALACGTPVAATNLPPLREFATDRLVFASGGRYVPLGIHHVHTDCLPLWWEPDADSLLEAVQRALALPKQPPSAEWCARWSWDGVAADFAREVLDAG